MPTNRLPFFANLIGLTAMLLSSGCVVRAYSRPPSSRATVRASGSASGSAQATVRPATPPPAQATVTVTAQQPTVATGVTVVEATCVQGAAEQCNGLDDNCNGEIDEGCGFQSGNIQVTLAWPTRADLDLYVTDPFGEQIFYGNERAQQSGGHLDHDARGGCDNQQADSNLENVYWNQANPPQGGYQINVHYWDGSRCSTNAGPTTFTLSISVGGQIIGAYNYTISPGQRVNVASFQI